MNEYQDKRLLGILEGIGDSLEDIAQSLRWLYEDARPEPDSETECEPCIDMDHQKGYE